MPAKTPRHKLTPILFPFHVFPGRESEGPISIIQPHQAEFLASAATFNLALWGIGSGKSITGAVKHLWKSMQRPGKVSAYIAQTGPILKRVVDVKIDELHETFRTVHGVPLVMHFHKTDKIYTLINRHQVWQIPSDDPQKLRGPEYTHVSIEEAGMIYHQEAVFTELVERGRMYKDFQVNMLTSYTPSSWIISHCRERVAQGDPNYWLTRHSSLANALVQKANIEMLRGIMSETKYRQEIESDDDADSGLTVYGLAFHREKSLSSFHPRDIAPEQRNTRFVLLVGIDWGTAQGHLVALVRDRHDNRDYIVDDLPVNLGGYAQSVAACAERIALYRDQWGLVPKAVYTDPTGKIWNRDLEGALKARKISSPIQYAWDKMDRDIQGGIELVRARLLTADGHRRLFLCRSVLKHEWNRANGRGIYPSFLNYRNKLTPDGENTGVAYDDDKHTHSMDATRYVYAFERMQLGNGLR